VTEIGGPADSTAGAAVWSGRLVVAMPTLSDPNFARTVVLLLTHAPAEGALGVVLTRPTQTDVAQVLPAWAPLATAPPLVFSGGPVQPDAAICLGRLRRTGTTAPGWAPLRDPLLGTVDLEGEPFDALEDVRVFAGYAGWSAGQLEGEVEAGGWWVLDALPGDAFTPRPDLLWAQVLRRQGPPLAYAVTYPADPGLN
jgi:putative transcriptional regulator